MECEDTIMGESPQPKAVVTFANGLLRAQGILFESIGSSHYPTSQTVTVFKLAEMFAISDVKPLAVYRAAGCLRESELREVVQCMVFAGPGAVLSALRLLNIMRGLPGNWELAMELLEQQKPDFLVHLAPRVTTLIALLGGRKAYHMCDWSHVVQRALRDGHEESRLAIHMVLEKTWSGSKECVYRIYEWGEELHFAENPSIWRELQWAAYSRALSMQVSKELISSVSHTGLSDAQPCVEQLPVELGPIARHYTRIGGILLRKRVVTADQGISGTNCPESTVKQPQSHVLHHDAFVITPSLRPVIQALVAALCYGVPVVVEGGSGCGKTSIISLLGRESAYKKPPHNSDVPGVTFIQMDSAMSDSDGDSFDSLVGAIVPLPEVGGFRWRPGPIGVAVEKGEWLVFENLGKVSTQSASAIPIIAQLATLSPGDTMTVPGRGAPLSVGKGFRCIATRTISDLEKEDHWEPPGGWGLWEKVAVPALSEIEQVEMLKRRFPLVKDCVSRVAKAIGCVSDFVRSNRGPLSRSSTLREAVRICARLNKLRAEHVDFLTAENALLETIDVLAAWCPLENQRMCLLEMLSSCWSLPVALAKELYSHHRPSYAREGLTLRIGRASMVAVHNDRISDLNRLTLTGHTLRLLERVLRCLQVDEHVLLTGEAGSGKTAVIQELACFSRKELVVINLSRQSELGDLIGTFRPVELAAAVPLLAKRFEEAFCLSMSRKKNGRFLDALQRASRSAEDHSRAVRLMEGAARAIPISAKNADEEVGELWRTITVELTKVATLLMPLNIEECKDNIHVPANGGQAFRERPRKRRKDGLATASIAQQPVSDSPTKRPRSRRRVDFRFSEGVLARAMRDGHWVLLDEINLAPVELLERLVSVVDRGQVLLPDEAGTLLTKSDGFRMFAAMNPPTDVGKRPLPGVLRARFSEFYCGDMVNKDDIIQMVLHRFYAVKGAVVECKKRLLQERNVANDIASFFLKCCFLGKEGRLEEVSGRPVRFSLRTLSRMLDFASGVKRYMKQSESGVRRALFEGALLSFATALPAASRSLVVEVAMTILLQHSTLNLRLESLEALVVTMTIPANLKDYVTFLEGFPLATVGKAKSLLHLRDKDVSFVISPTVRRTLQDVCRSLSLGTQRLPIILQGPTAAGKTSLVTYLAAITGNRLIRMNNHEHTDLAEYLGGYVATPNGSLVFHEGPLVQAARAGSWVLLDELNLAPPEVLESLNRLLDDNRELLLPETGEVVKAAPGFTIFATQNPPGLYGGRKELSQAFRSRFVEIQVCDLPDEDLLMILEQRCQIPISFAKRMIAVMRELQLRRRTTSLFSGRDGFVTARDLFRWASRGPRSKEELAVHGFFLLGERSRLFAEKETVRSILVSAMGVDKHLLDDVALYSFGEPIMGTSPARDCLDLSLNKLSLSREVLLHALRAENIVPTTHMRRMLTLLIHGIANSEPALLVGGTGSGKTSCCSVISRALRMKLLTVNCHQHTEASDILGSFRPVRSVGLDGPLFEWVDGPLVRAMKDGDVVLIDEINMAEDAVIERLNSVLELERTILLSEKGAIASSNRIEGELGLFSEVIVADSSFRILATMNPGGDFGKKELSPALRNRFTEIWVPPPSTLDEFSPIVRTTLSVRGSMLRNEKLELAEKILCDFLQWCLESFQAGVDVAQKKYSFARYAALAPRLMFSVRDVATWCDFIVGSVKDVGIDPLLALVHGARLVFLDGLSVGSTGVADRELESQVWKRLTYLLPGAFREMAEAAKYGDEVTVGALRNDVGRSSAPLKFGLFNVPQNDVDSLNEQARQTSTYSFDAPCTMRNSARLARAMAIGTRPILLEGPPGCGKSSLITALAQAAGFPFVRINLSDSTEMSDLVGTESPGQVPGTFAFRSGPLLTALRRGSWVLLDELNLASQSVLEGLNSVLDHRKSLYIPELNEEVSAHASFRVFGAQNPAFDGGGRRGLPKSFLNRFTKVHMETPTKDDILSILSSVHSSVDAETSSNIVDSLCGVKADLIRSGLQTDMASFGLRDALRWCDLYTALQSNLSKTDGASISDSDVQRFHLGLAFDVVVLQGLKAGMERKVAENAFQTAFGFNWNPVPNKPFLTSSDDGVLRIGQSLLYRSDDFFYGALEPYGSLLLSSQLRTLQALSFAVNSGWPVVICSETAHATDGIQLVHSLATLCGKTVKRVHGGSLTDSDEFMGGYCQQDVVHEMQKILTLCDDISKRCICISVQAESSSSRCLCLTSVTSVLAHTHEMRRILDIVSSNSYVRDEVVSEFMLVLNLFSVSVRDVSTQDERLAGRMLHLRQMENKLNALNTVQDGSFASFEWKKSGFVDAIEAGEWIVVNEAETCSPAILDRLNPILERPALDASHGKFSSRAATVAPVILAEAPPNEDGSPVLLRPHPDFRIFFLFSSHEMGGLQKGLSRALLDRSLKLSLAQASTQLNSSVVEVRHGADSNTVVYPYASLSNQRFQIASRTISKADVCIGPEVLDKVCPRTYEADFALNGSHQLLERELSALNVIEAVSFSNVSSGEINSSLMLAGGETSSIVPSLTAGLPLALEEETVRSWSQCAAAEGFILASQSFHDLHARCQVLRRKAERSTSPSSTESYRKIAEFAERWYTAKVNDKDLMHDRNAAHLSILPIDPLYAGDMGSIFVALWEETERKRLISIQAKQFRIAILALEAFHTSWKRACDASRQGSDIEEALFSRAKLGYEVAGKDAVSMSGTHAVEALCYEVLFGITHVCENIVAGLNHVSEWSLPEERSLIALLISAKELCDHMAAFSSPPPPELYSRVVEIIASANAINRNIDTKWYGISDILSSRVLEGLEFVTDVSVPRRLLLMPSTERGQLAESHMLTLCPGYVKGVLSFREVDGFIKGLVSLSAEKVEEDNSILQKLHEVAETLTSREMSERSGVWQLPFWTQMALVRAVNLFRDVMSLMGEGGRLKNIPQNINLFVQSISKALFCTKCVPRINVGSLVALQRLHWILDNGGQVSKVSQLEMRELHADSMSSFLRESSNVLLFGIGSKQEEREKELSEHGLLSNLFMFTQNSSLYPFWGLLSIHREAVSAMAWVTVGWHQRNDSFEGSCQLIKASLHSALSYAKVLSVEQIDVLNREVEKEAFDALLHNTRVEMDKCENHSDVWELCRLQADAILKVHCLVSEKVLPHSSTETSQIVNNVVLEMSREGDAWISLGLLRLRSYHRRMKQRNGIDPSEIARVTATLNFKNGVRAKVGIDAYSVQAKHRLGGDSISHSTPICRLEEDRMECVVRFSEAAKQYVFRPLDRASFSSLSATVNTVNAVITEKVVRNGPLRNLITLQACKDTSQSLEEASDLHQSCDATAEKFGITGTLSHFRDITIDLTLGLRELQYGLAIGIRLAKLSTLSVNAALCKRAEAFFDATLFPRAAFKSAMSVSDALQVSHSAGVQPVALVSCADYLITSTLQGFVRSDEDVSQALSYIVDIWKKANIVAEEKKKRQKSLHILREAGLKEEVPGIGFVENLELDEEKDFVDTFNPIKSDEEDALLGLENALEGVNEEAQVLPDEPPRCGAGIDCDAFWNIHVKVFPANETQPALSQDISQQSSVVQSFAKQLFSMCDGIHLLTDGKYNPWTLFAAVEVAQTFEATTVATRTKDAMVQISSQTAEIDFYRDANPDELANGSRALQNLNKAVSRMQKGFFSDTGDHPVLAEVSLAIQRVADSCTVSSPLSRVVVGIENVLRKADEWRRLFATSATRMDQEVLALSRVAAKWRKLERSSWKLLLQNRQKSAASRASIWFFYLYDALVHEAMSTPQLGEDACQNIVAVVDQFLRSSPSGEFVRRLEMIFSLGNHILSINDPANVSMNAIGLSLRGIGRYYSLFAPQVANELKKATGLIEGKLNEFSRLLSWNPDPGLGSSQKMAKGHEKHLEYYRLKAAAERTKRKLHKLCLEMDSVLRIPVYEHLTKEIGRIGFETLERNDEDRAVSDDRKNSKVAGKRVGERISSSADHLVAELTSLCGKLGNVLPDRQDPGTSPSKKKFLSKLYSLEERLMQLGQMVGSTGRSECEMAVNFCRNTRFAVRSRALELRRSKSTDIQPKKRAMYDLLKGLRHIGLSPFEPQASSVSSEPLFWLTSPDPSQNAPYNSIANELFLVGAQQLRRLREMSDSRIRSPDITADEAQKSRAFCKHLFDMACSQRSSMKDYLIDIAYVSEAVSLLQEDGTKSGAHRDRRWSGAARKHLLDIICAMKKMCIDFELVARSIKVALDTSEQVQDFKSSDVSQTLIQHQLPETKVQMVKLSAIFSLGTKSLRTSVRSEELSKLRLNSGKAPVVSISDHEGALERVRVCKSSLEEQLAKCRALSNNNVGTQVLAPTVEFLQTSLRALDAELGSSPSDNCGNAEDLMSRTEELCEVLVEKALIGAQNVLIWSKAPLHGEEVHQGVNWENEQSESRQFPQTQFLLQSAHKEFMSFGSRSNIAELSSILKELIRSRSVLTDLEMVHGRTEFAVQRIFNLQKSVGSFIALYTRKMVLPCISHLSLMHCHSLALLKTLSAVFAGICAEGFCRPPDDPQASDHGNDAAECAGTGFGDVGDGDITGAQDVSEQIEEEEQLLGLQNDVSEKGVENEHRSGQGFEMTTDFEGDMEDVELSGDDAKNGGSEDDEMGLSGEGGDGKDVIDEKLWNQGDEIPNRDGAERDESTVADAAKSTELAAKEADHLGSTEKEEEGRNENNMKENSGVEDSRPEAEDQKLNDDKHNAESNEKNPAKLSTADEEDVEGPESNTATKSPVEDPAHEDDAQGLQDGVACENEEAPFDKEEEHERSREKGETEDMANDIPMNGTALDDINDSGDGGNKHDPRSDQDSDCEMEDLSLDVADEFADVADDGVNDENIALDETNLPHDGMDPQTEGKNEENGISNRGDDVEPSGIEKEEHVTMDIAKEDKVPTAGPTAAEQLDTGTMTTLDETSTLDRNGNASAFPAPANTSVTGDDQRKCGTSGSGAGEKEGSEPGLNQNRANRFQGGDNTFQSTISDSMQGPDPNPLRAAVSAEVISNWSKYLKVVQEEREMASRQESKNKEDDDGVWEFTEGDKDPGEKVALGAANEEQHQSLPDHSHEDTHKDEMVADNTNVTNLEQTSVQETPANVESHQQQASHDNRLAIPPEAESIDTAEDSGKDREVRSHPARIAAEALDHQNQQSVQTRSLKRTSNLEEEDIAVPEDEIQAIDDLPDAEILPADEKQTWKIEDLGQEDATRLWRKLNQVSSTGADALCEQLRLVLEPTIASRLGGGYRTGKRLNIRKVIEFVASDFRRDRIWLRRVRPDKRAYDVLLAIDDSESMTESQAGPMALESLALITTALAKLEIGRIAVASFGAATHMVREFNEPLPLSDQRGGELLQHFCFSQKETNVPKLLAFIEEAMMGVESFGDMEQIKLAFVISDGRLSGREDIKRRLRCLRDRNILVAFIIVDTLSESKTSIYDVRRVEYDSTGKVQVLPYMQDFPIEFYSVVQDVHLLPNVLADALRQWVEITSAPQ